MAFGNTLKQIIEDKGISAAELSRRTGIAKTTLSGIFKSDTDKISIELFLDICNAIGCDPEDFYRNYKNYRKTAEKPPPLKLDEQQLLDDFRLLNDEGQAAAIGAVKAFTMLDQYKKSDKNVLAG